MAKQSFSARPFETLIPARLDRLPWSGFHWLVVIALGITWTLDGLEVTLSGAVSGVLQDPQVMNFSPAAIGSIASAYLLGAVLGSLLFGYLTDRWGRKKLFFLTLGIYLLGTLLTAFSWNFWSFAAFRFITGSGIGGEYAAISSAIDELIPAAFRGRVNLMVNGSYWLGAGLGSLSTLIILDPHILNPKLGWRLGFATGALLGLLILLLRRHVPESPRWLMTHGDEKDAESAMKEIERRVEESTDEKLPEPRTETVDHSSAEKFWIRRGGQNDAAEIPRAGGAQLVADHVAGVSVQRCLFYLRADSHAVLRRAGGRTGIYLLPFAIGNFLGPLLLGRFFDTVGRREMISSTYAISAVLLTITGWAFAHGMLSANSQTLLWTIIFFFASAAASAAYLTVSEIFPLEIRALAIAFFFSLGTAAGGIAAPWLFGVLIGSGSREKVFYGYLVAGALMLAAAAIELGIGVKAERSSLEELASPLSSEI